jgi:hypothetical protein
LKLFDAVSTRFEHVRMLGAAPFAGVTVAAFGNDEEPDVAIDSSLTEHAEQPLAYVAIGSHQPLRVDPYLVVQLPWSSVASSANAQGAPSAPPPQDTAHAEAMAELTSRERNARKEAEERGRTITALSARVAELEEALEGAEARRRANQNDRDRALDEKQRELDAMLDGADLPHKLDIIRAGHHLGVDFSLTHSCYDPILRNHHTLACGHCDSCSIRRQGFIAANLPDPTPYA